MINPKRDAVIYEAWIAQNGVNGTGTYGFTDYLARYFVMTPKQVRLAFEREKRRRNKNV